MRFIGHATAVLDLGGVRVMTDPFLRTTLGPLQRHGPLPESASFQGVDVVIISHGHPDHFDRRSLQMIGGQPLVVVPRGLRAWLRGSVRGEIVEMVAGERLTVGPLTVTGIPARHWIGPGAPRAAPMGFHLDAGVRVYFAGDTGRFAAMAALAGKVDVALLPVWTWGPHMGPGHLGPRSAAEALVDIAPVAAVPIHWGTLYPRRLHQVWRRPLDEPGDRFAAHAALLAPGVDVRVVRPGGVTTIEMTPHPPSTDVSDATPAGRHRA